MKAKAKKRESLVPFSAGHQVVEISVTPAGRWTQLVKVISHDGDWCRLENGRVYNRTTGEWADAVGVDSREFYHAIHSPGYEGCRAD